MSMNTEQAVKKKHELEVQMHELEVQMNVIIAAITDLCIEHDMYFDLGGSFLVTNQDTADNYNREIGDWVNSSETC